MHKRQLALDIYMSRMFKIIMISVPLIAVSAGLTFTIFKLCGAYQNVPWAALIVFDSTNVLYCFIGAYFALRCEDKIKP